MALDNQQTKKDARIKIIKAHRLTRHEQEHVS